jgi:hypothetical protein
MDLTTTTGGSVGVGATPPSDAIVGYAISLSAGTSEVLIENGISVRANNTVSIAD